MASFFEFSDDEDYVPPESEQLSSKQLPPLSLGMGAKASMRVEDVYKNARRYSDSSRFSIPLTGAANQHPSTRTQYAMSDESGVDTEPEQDENDVISDVEPVDKTFFDYRLGSTHTFTQTEIKLTAPARGASFSSDHIDELVMVDRPPLDGLNSLSRNLRRENDPFQVPPHTPEEFQTKLDDSEMIDIQSFVHKLDGVRPPRHRRLHSFDTYDELHNAKGKRSPHATPQNEHEPRTFEKLVQKVYKMTPRGADEVPFYDGVYEQETDAYPPIPEDTKILPTVSGQVLDTIPIIPEPVMVPVEEVNKFKRWMEMHGIDPAIVDEPPRPPTFPMNGRFLCPSPNGVIPPLLSKSSGGMSMFSASSGTDISRLGITPSPVTPNQPTIRDLKLREELQAAIVESNAKNCALKQAVEQLGRIELEMEKFKQKAKMLEEENTSLRTQVNDLVKSRQKILVSANTQFDVFRRKINPPEIQVTRK